VSAAGGTTPSPASGRPRLLWLSHVLPHPPQGGVLQRSFHLIRAAARAYDVDLVTFYQRAFHPDAAAVAASVAALGELVRVRRVFDLPADAGPLRRRWLEASSLVTREPYTVRWNRSRALEAYLPELARETRYDVVHFDTIGMFAHRDAFPAAAWALNHHNVESHMVARRAAGARGLLRAALSWEALRLARYEREPGGRADLHVVVSELDAARLRAELPGAAVQVVENPVDVSYFRPTGTLEEEPGSVVFAGRIDAYSNAAAVRWMRDAIWPRLLRGGVAKALWIVGRNPPPDLVAWGRSDPSVTVTGYVDDVRPWLERAQVYLCPITDGGGTRLKLLDAMAMQRAIVSHPMALEGLDVKPGEHVLVAGDAEGLAREVERALGDAALRERLGRAARERAEALYSTEAVERHLLQAYERARAIRASARPR